MEGRIGLMTAVTPSYAHAYQSLCLAGRLFVVHHQKFRLPASKARYPNLPNSRTTTREKGIDFQGWAISSLRAKPQLGGAPSPALLMESYVSCWAQSSQPKHISRMQVPDSSPTARLNSGVSLRRFPSLSPMALLPVTHKRVYSTIPGTGPAFAWALSNHARTSPWGSPASVSSHNSNLRL